MLQIESPLVSIDWLYQNFEADNLVILDASIPKVTSKNVQKESYFIPNSRFFDIKKAFSDISAQFPNTLPSLSQFETEAQKLGVNTTSAIVVYDKLGMYSSARAYWLFKVFGHTNVAVLDGGLPEWKAKGFNLESSITTTSNIGNFKASFNSRLMTDFDGIQAYSASKNHLVIDARSENRFKCEIPEPRKNLRSGNIPNSVNLPYTNLLDGYKMKSKTQLKAIFDELNPATKHLVFSCGTGITACVLALGATLANYRNSIVYDGSWTEYGTLTT